MVSRGARIGWLFVGVVVKPVGKLDAGNPHVGLCEGKPPAACRPRSSALPRLYAIPR